MSLLSSSSLSSVNLTHGLNIMARLAYILNQEPNRETLKTMTDYSKRIISMEEIGI